MNRRTSFKPLASLDLPTNSALKEHLKSSSETTPAKILPTLFGEHAAKAGYSVNWEEFIRDAKAVQPDLRRLKA